MNRKLRRMLGISRRPETVRLRGGPMDGWLVTPDAPSLRRDWWYTLPPTIGALWPTYGAYVRAGDLGLWTDGERE
jgi:hypothetical protein